MHIKTVFLAIFSAFLLLGNARADDETSRLMVTAKFGTQIIDGFTQYELKFLYIEEGDYRIYGHSRLKFPFTNYLTGGCATARYRGFWMSAGYWEKYRYNREHTMEDFDWLSSSDGDYLQVAYGTTTPHTDMNYYQLELGYEFMISHFRISPFFRFSRYHSEYDMIDLSQLWYYDLTGGEEYDPPLDTTIEGQVLYYEQDLNLPTFGLSASYPTLGRKLDFYTNLAYSPFISVDDFDDHVIREDSLEAVNSGSGGSSLLMEIGVRANVYEGLWLNGEFSYSDYSINTSGTQRSIDDVGYWQEISGISTQVRGVMRKFSVTFSYIFAM